MVAVADYLHMCERLLNGPTRVTRRASRVLVASLELGRASGLLCDHCDLGMTACSRWDLAASSLRWMTSWARVYTSLLMALVIAHRIAVSLSRRLRSDSKVDGHGA